MANVTIRLVVEPGTRKKTIIISYEDDGSALPIEHEEEHRRIVDKLIEGGAIKASEVGKIVIDREQEKVPTGGEAVGNKQDEREALKNKG